MDGRMDGWMDGWMDAWMEEALQSGRSKLICEQMEIMPCTLLPIFKCWQRIRMIEEVCTAQKYYQYEYM